MKFSRKSYMAHYYHYKITFTVFWIRAEKKASKIKCNGNVNNTTKQKEEKKIK